jgi:hypothetical protein
MQIPDCAGGQVFGGYRGAGGKRCAEEQQDKSRSDDCHDRACLMVVCRLIGGYIGKGYTES